MASVTMDRVNKYYGDVHAVKDFNLEVGDREFLVLVGPSGCGKSTTLRLIAGLEDISSGTISIGEQVVNHVEPRDRDIAMVFQNYALYPHMNVYDNMAFGLKLRKRPKEEIDRRVKEAADILGIGELLDRKPKALSGGQRQRVALGRAIVRQPKVFLMDEPLSNLDAKLRVQTRTELSRLHDELQTTVIYVTHDQTEAMTMGDRIVVMNDGVIQQVASPQELYDNPANMFVAGFIGSPAMNFLDCKLVAKGDSLVAAGDGFELTLPASKAARLNQYTGTQVKLGVRPEDIYITEPKLEQYASATIDAVIDVVEPMGAEIFLYLKTGQDQFTARVEPRTKASSGDRIKTAVDTKMIHFFDAATGVNLDQQELENAS